MSAICAHLTHTPVDTTGLREITYKGPPHPKRTAPPLKGDCDTDTVLRTPPIEGPRGTHIMEANTLKQELESIAAKLPEQEATACPGSEREENRRLQR